MLALAVLNLSYLCLESLESGAAENTTKDISAIQYFWGGQIKVVAKGDIFEEVTTYVSQVPVRFVRSQMQFELEFSLWILFSAPARFLSLEDQLSLSKTNIWSECKSIIDFWSV